MKFLGLLFIIAAIGMLFFLWAQALRSKARSPEEALQESAVEECFTQSNDFRPNLQLLPDTPATTHRTALETDVRESEALPDVETEEAAQTISKVEADALSSTQLEIANQFFQIGDFEGAIELSEIVLDSPNSSTSQKDKARQIIELCA